MKRRLQTKKVLVAAIGVATVSYAFACGDTQSTSGNLMAPDTDASPVDARSDSDNADVSSSGNLMPPPPPPDAAGDTSLDTGADTALDTGADVSSSGNLMPPPDASND